MRLLERDVEPCQAKVQVKSLAGGWLDWCSIKDTDDCQTAERLMDERHFRVVMNDWWDGVMHPLVYDGGAWEIKTDKW